MKIVKISEQPRVKLGEGLYGQAGMRAWVSVPIGMDKILVEPGASFPVHTHEGGHLLYVLKGRGTVTVGQVTYDTEPGECYFIAGGEPHSVGAKDEAHELLAVGVPHTPIDAPNRMEVLF